MGVEDREVDDPDRPLALVVGRTVDVVVGEVGDQEEEGGRERPRHELDVERAAPPPDGQKAGAECPGHGPRCVERVNPGVNAGSALE